MSRYRVRERNIRLWGTHANGAEFLRDFATRAEARKAVPADAADWTIFEIDHPEVAGVRGRHLQSKRHRKTTKHKRSYSARSKTTRSKSGRRKLLGRARTTRARNKRRMYAVRHAHAPRGSRAKSSAILAARYIVQGDFDRARKELRGRTSFSVAEARALTGAAREATRLYGAPKFDPFV